MADLSEIEFLITTRQSLNERTKTNYINYYKRLRVLLKNDVNKSSEEDIIKAIDDAKEIDKKTKENIDIPVSVKLSLLNVAIVIRQVFELSEQDLIGYRIILNKKLNVSNVERNVRLKDELPSVKEISEFVNTLYEKGRYMEFIINYLILNLNTRNADLNLIITRNAEDVHNKDNFIVVRKESARYIRYVFKTANAYDCKENIISSKKVIIALNSLLGDKNQVPLLTTIKGDRILEISLSKFVSRKTYKELGQGTYLKAILNEKHSMDVFEKVSANRGTNLNELNRFYNPNFENANGKMEEQIKISKCVNKIPIGQTGADKIKLKKELKQQEMDKLKE